MSHLACSGDKNNESNQNQIENFKRITHNMPERKTWKLWCNIVWILLTSRPGIALYGGKYLEFGIKPTTKLRSKSVQLKI